MNWYKIAQNQLFQQYNQLLQHSPVDIQITGTGTNQSIQIPGAPNISARDLLQKAVNKIKPILLQNNVKTIDTSPISKADAAGVAKSNRPGVVFIDLPKLFNSFRQALPPITQLDGVKTDPDVVNEYVNRISAEIIKICAHESKHILDLSNSYQTGKPFSSVQEAPAEQFEKQVVKKVFPSQTFSQ